MNAEPWDKYSIDVGHSWSEILPAWRNFIHHVQDLYPDVHWSETNKDQIYGLINKELQSYNAIRTDQETSFARVTFKEEKHMTAFLLRWS
jgi:hypothetical protein